MEMEPWAHRIYSRMGHLGRTQAELAKACNIKEPSVSGWFGKGSRPTRMIGGDNLVLAAKFLGVTPEWIITGKGRAEAAMQGHSHPVRLDRPIVASVARTLLQTYTAEGLVYDFTKEWELFVELYDAAVLGELQSTGGEVKIGRWIERKSPQGADSGTGKTGVPASGTHTRNKGVRREA